MTPGIIGDRFTSDHHIIDYEKRIKWQNTIFAWFAKWLKDDDSWWKSMYDKMEE